jgi:hypothetical protein
LSSKNIRGVVAVHVVIVPRMTGIVEPPTRIVVGRPAASRLTSTQIRLGRPISIPCSMTNDSR